MYTKTKAYWWETCVVQHVHFASLGQDQTAPLRACNLLHSSNVCEKVHRERSGCPSLCGPGQPPQPHNLLGVTVLHRLSQAKKKNSMLFNIKNRWSHHCDVIIECEHLQCKLQTCSSTYLALQVTSTIFLNFLLNIWSRYCNFIYAFLTWQIRSTMQPERQEIFINLYQQ